MNLTPQPIRANLENNYLVGPSTTGVFVSSGKADVASIKHQSAHASQEKEKTLSDCFFHGAPVWFLMPIPKPLISFFQGQHYLSAVGEYIMITNTAKKG